MLSRVGPRRYVKASEIVNDGRQVSLRKPEHPPKREYSYQVPNERSPLRSYGYGKQGVIKSLCPTCNLNASQRTDVATNHINAYTAKTRSRRLTLIGITFCGIKGRETTLAMTLAEGQQTKGKALTTQAMVEIEGRSVLTKFIILPKAKVNRTLLGTDFLSSAGLDLDAKNTCWYFWDNPTNKYPFGEKLDTLSIVEKMSSNTSQLREGEGGVATNILEHHINTGNSPPISVPPYRMSPVKNCPDGIKYKASNQKPSRLLQTPVPTQRFETLAIDLFVFLPESKDTKIWILIIEDCTTKWVELFALPSATGKECAIILIEEVLLRYGIPRRLISDNRTQFVSAVMQQICYLLNIHQSLIPVYHPQAIPVEPKNRDL
ncbi:transposon Tf2-8 polyprotein [Trichonephila clavipes]|nr:transposon Tf2-8 polyprotein [Trichonephila clavipes]